MSFPTIEEHIEQGSSWTRSESGYTVKHSGEPYRGEYEVSPDKLSEHNRQLGALIDFLYDYWLSKHSYKYLPGDVVRATLLHWAGKGNPHVNISGVEKYIEMVTYFPGSKEDTDKETMFMSYELTQTTVPGSEHLGFIDNLVPHVSAIGTTNMSLSKVWLDSNYPGWDNRFAAGKTLGLNDWAMAGFIFDGGESGPTVDLTAVAFE